MRKILVFVLIAIVAALSSIPSSAQSGWCYDITFTSNNGSFTSNTMTWDNVNGWFSRNVWSPGQTDYAYRGIGGQTSQVQRVQITLRYSSGLTSAEGTPVIGTVNFNILGLTGSYTLPSTNGASLVTDTRIFESSTAYGNNISMDFTKLGTQVGNVAIDRITMYGIGTNPFGSSNCNTAYPTPASFPTSTPPPTLDPACTLQFFTRYYDFTVSQNNWLIDAGSYVPGVGIRSNNSGNVIVDFFFSHQFRVDRVDVEFTSVSQINQGAITYYDYNTQVLIQNTTKAGLSGTQKDVFTVSPGRNIDNVNIYYNAGLNLYLKKVTVFGYGCPIPLPEGQATATPSPTPTATQTSIPTWECTFDFSIDEQDWFVDWYTPDPWGGTYVAGQYWTWEYNSYEIGGDLGACEGVDNCNNRRALDMRYDATVGMSTITSIDILMDFTSGTNPHNRLQYDVGGSRTNLLNENPPTTSVGTGITWSWTGTVNTDNLILHLIPFSNQTGGAVVPTSGDTKVYEITVAGTGENYFCGAPTSTATPTPTATPEYWQPTAAVPYGTVTATQDWSIFCYLENDSFNQGIANWTGDASAENGRVRFDDAEYIEQSFDAQAETRYLVLQTSIVDPGAADDDGSYSFIYTITKDSDSSVLATGTLTTTEEDYYSASAGRGVMQVPVTFTATDYTLNLTADLTNVDQVALLAACFSTTPYDVGIGTGSTGAGYKCGDTISQPALTDGLGAWVDYLWNAFWQWLICGLIPLIRGILDFFVNFGTWLINSIFHTVDWIGRELIPWLISTGANLITQIGNVIEFLLRWVPTALQDLWNLITAAWRLIVKFFEYIGDFFDLVLNFSEVYANAEPLEIAGMPQCLTAPTASNICAMYYIMENTIFGNVQGVILRTALLGFFDLMLIQFAIGLFWAMIKDIRWITK